MRWLRSPEPTCSLRDSASARFCFSRSRSSSSRLEPLHRLVAVRVLRALVLAFDDDAGRQVRDADRRVGLVDVLAAGAGRAERVDLQIGRIDFDVVDLVDFGQDRDRCGRGVDASLRFGFRHALHAVRAGLELEPRERALAFDARDDFLVAAVLAVARREDLDAPAAALGVARVHAEQIAGEDRGFVAAGAGAHFEEEVGVVAFVLRDQQHVELAVELVAFAFERGDLVVGERLQLRILEHRARRFERAAVLVVGAQAPR